MELQIAAKNAARLNLHQKMFLRLEQTKLYLINFLLKSLKLVQTQFTKFQRGVHGGIFNMIPILFSWDGEVMSPTHRFSRECNSRFVVGQTYLFEEINERSSKSHNHFFSSINEAFLNLPESIADQYPSSDHLRKKALIACGYADERSIACSSKAEAQRVAAFVKPMDDYAVVVVREAVVRVYTAKSQSMKAMGKTEFQNSKTKVLDYVAALVGVSPRNSP